MPIDDALRQKCERVVRDLMDRYGWHLLEEAELVRLVFERAVMGERNIARIAKNEYSSALYAACNPNRNPNPSRQTQAFDELGRYLYSIALGKQSDPEEAKEATQQALVNIYEALRADEIDAPGTFLSGCIHKLRGALTYIDRSSKIGGKLPHSLEERGGRFAGSVEEIAERQCLLKTELLDELKRKFEIHPRATRQLEAVLRRYLGGERYQEIAGKVNAPSVGAVSTLISRGKEKLAQNEELREIYERWFTEF